jgi:hypothetical protein
MQSELTIARPQITPLELIERASASGASIEVPQQLFELKLRVEADEARKAYDAAMAAFKSHPPRITKNKEVAFGTTKYSHATLDHVTDVLTSALSHVGISHRFEVAQTGENVSVSCILRHAAGHSERTMLSGPIDKSGSKNAIQSIGSAVTYLQRYTLLAAVGMAAGGQDDDGASAGPKAEMAEQQYAAAMDAIEGSRTVDELRAAYKQAFKAAEDARDTDAMKAFTKSKDAKKQELAR